MTTLTLYIGNSMVLELQDLTDVVTGDPVVDATVTATLKNRIGAEVDGQTWPVTLDHVSEGTYRAILEDDLDVVEGRPYTAIVVAIGYDDEAGHWEAPVKATVRGLCGE